MNTQGFDISYVPDLSALPLLYAERKGLFQSRDIKVHLKKVSGWRIIREMVSQNKVDASVIMSPMLYSSVLGINGHQRHYSNAIVLSRGGMALTLGNNLKGIQSLKDLKGKTLAVPHRYSNNYFLLCHILAEAGLDPLEDLIIDEIIPERLTHYLERGAIDGFLGTEPYNQIAAYNQWGFIFKTSSSIWKNHPSSTFVITEKALADKKSQSFDVMHVIEESQKKLSKASDMELVKIAKKISGSDYIKGESHIPILRALRGRFDLDQQQEFTDSDYINFTNTLSYNSQKWILTQMQRWDQIPYKISYSELSEGLYDKKSFTTDLTIDKNTPAEKLLKNQPEEFLTGLKYSRFSNSWKNHSHININREARKKLQDINSYLVDVAAGNENTLLEKSDDGEIGELEELIYETIENLKSTRESVKEERDLLAKRVKSRTKELLQNRSTIMRMMKNTERARRQSEAANASKSEFLANMSHEIRTPMNGIIGAADMMKYTELNTDQNKFLGIISESAKSLLNIINDILDLSKIEAEKVDLELIPMDLHEVLYKTVEMLKITAANKGLDLQLKIDDSSSRFIQGDQTRIGQIMINLVNNAVKFTEKGSIIVQLKKREEDLVHISVVDTGIGIAKNKQNQIFESFSQSDSSTTREHGGTGLGLTITKKLINMMDGEIKVVSELHMGSTFSFYIKAPVAQEPQLEKSTKKSPCDKAIEICKSAKKLKVLVVEDHPVNMKIIHFMLSKKECDIYEAENGEIAIELFQKVEPDLVFMDMQMPVMNGLEATKEIRKLEKELRMKRTTITALTANAMKEDIEKTKAAVMDSFLAKPVTFEDISAIIDQIEPEQNQEPEEVQIEISNSTFDYKGLVELFSGNKEIANELLGEFLDGTNPFMKKLEEYVEQSDYSSIEKSAHTMKGQLLNLRAGSLADDFARLEKEGREKKTEAIESTYIKCKTSMADLKDNISKMITGG